MGTGRANGSWVYDDPRERLHREQSVPSEQFKAQGVFTKTRHES